VGIRIEGKIGSGKAIIVVGPRQVGKTTLIQTVLQSKKDVLFLNGDDPLVRQMMTNPNTEELKNLIGTHPYTFIDEAQRIKNHHRPDKAYSTVCQRLFRF
jgi:predicted AAA+ superfamily ATPase